MTLLGRAHRAGGCLAEVGDGKEPPEGQPAGTLFLPQAGEEQERRRRPGGGRSLASSYSGRGASWAWSGGQRSPPSSGHPPRHKGPRQSRSSRRKPTLGSAPSPAPQPITPPPSPELVGETSPITPPPSPELVGETPPITPPPSPELVGETSPCTTALTTLAGRRAPHKLQASCPHSFFFN